MSDSGDKRIGDGVGNVDSDRDSDGGEERHQKEEPEHEKSPGQTKPPRRKTPLGQLPDSLDEVNTSPADEKDDVAKGFSGVAVMSAIHPYGQIGLDDKPRSAVVGLGGATLVPPPVSRMQDYPLDKRKGPIPVISPPSGHWNLTDSDVKTLPDFHPLERSAVFVPNCSDAAVVARRVSDVLRSRSISAEYINAKAKAKCMTTDDVDFRIRLYRGKKKFSHGVIVEVQRRFGFSTTFASDVAAICDAAEGKVAAPSTPTGLLPSLVPDEEDHTESSNDEDDGLESVKIASSMISEADIDRKIMGLQGLASLTDSYKIGKATATRASTEILAGTNPEAAAARDAILSLVLCRDGSTEAAQRGQVEDKLTDADEANRSLLRTQALCVLSNVLCNMVKRDELRSLKPVLSQAILPALLRDIENASVNPRTADLATRALLPVVQTFDGDFVESDLLANGAYELLIEAQSVGEARFDSLREQSASCLRALDAVKS